MLYYAVVQVYQCLSVGVRVLTGHKELQPGRQMRRWDVYPRQVEQHLSLLQELRGLTLIRALLQGGLKPLEKEAITRPTGVAVIGANQRCSALDYEHSQREEQVKVLQACLSEGGLTILIQTAAGVHTMSQQQLCGFQAEVTNLSGVLHAGLQGLLNQKHQRGLSCFTVYSSSINVSTCSEEDITQNHICEQTTVMCTCA